MPGGLRERGRIAPGRRQHLRSATELMTILGESRGASNDVREVRGRVTRCFPCPGPSDPRPAAAHAPVRRLAGPGVIEVTTIRERGSHGPTIDRPPPAGLGGRPPGLRA